MNLSTCVDSTIDTNENIWKWMKMELNGWYQVKTGDGAGGTMGHIIALPYPKNWIDLSAGNPMLNIFFFINWYKKVYIFFFIYLVFEHKPMLWNNKSWPKHNLYRI